MMALNIKIERLLRSEEPFDCKDGVSYRRPDSMKRIGPVPGFTLIELLVVIAIVAVLAAFLFPVFVKVREKARQTACTSNLRQVTLGIFQYSQDFDDRCPLYSDNAGSYWPQFVAPYVQKQATADFNGASRVFVCPSAPYDAAKVTAFANSALASYGLSDNWVDAVCPDDCPDPTGVPHAFGEATAPANTILLAETMYRTESELPGYSLALPPIDGGNRGFLYSACDSAGRPGFSPSRMLMNLSWRHSVLKLAWCAVPPGGARVSVAYADGHIKSLPVPELSLFRAWSLSQGSGSFGCRQDADGKSGCWYP